MKKALIALVILAVLGGVAAFIPVGGDSGGDQGATEPGPAMDLSEYSAEPPSSALELLFIHHSVGGALLADRGEASGEHQEQCIWESHPDGGGLRSRLEDAGYQVHEASYGSAVGNATDMFDWLPKFRDDMDRVLTVDEQDSFYEDGRRNQIVVFKSCFPNSDFVDEGSEPGDPAGPELTVWNARASMSALLEHFSAHQDTLFVYVTAPPLEPPHGEALWRWLAKTLLGRQQGAAEQYRRGALARRFNNWMRSPEGWLADYPHDNVVVFDYFDILTDVGETNLSRYPTRGGHDPHPNAGGNGRAAEAFLPFINRAVRRAGLGGAASPDGDGEPEQAEPSVAEAGAPDAGAEAGELSSGAAEAGASGEGDGAPSGGE